MKTITILGIVAFSGMVLTSCSSNSQTSNTKDETTISSLKKENASLKSQLTADLDENTNSKHVTLAKIGFAQYTITSVKTETISNSSKNYSNAEYNFDGIKQFPSKYYRTTIGYQLKNTGNKAFELSLMQSHVIDANGVEYTDAGTDTFGFDDNSNGDVYPNTATTGKFILLSTTTPKLSTFTISTSEQRNGLDTLAQGGTATYKKP